MSNSFLHLCVILQNANNAKAWWLKHLWLWYPIYFTSWLRWKHLHRRRVLEWVNSEVDWGKGLLESLQFIWRNLWEDFSSFKNDVSSVLNCLIDKCLYSIHYLMAILPDLFLSIDKLHRNVYLIFRNTSWIVLQSYRLKQINYINIDA